MFYGPCLFLLVFKFYLNLPLNSSFRLMLTMKWYHYTTDSQINGRVVVQASIMPELMPILLLDWCLNWTKRLVPKMFTDLNWLQISLWKKNQTGSTGTRQLTTLKLVWFQAMHPVWKTSFFVGKILPYSGTWLNRMMCTSRNIF